MKWSALAEKVHQSLIRNSLLKENTKLLLAISGGMDSVVMLRVFLELRKTWEWELVVGHIDHGLRPGQDEKESNLCRSLAQDHQGITLSGENKRQVFIPEGFAHGFCVLSETAYFSYKCSDFYAPGDEGGLLWSDPGIGIQWPVCDAIISEKDRDYPLLADLAPEQLPRMGANV